MFLWNVVIAATLVALRHGHDLADLVAGCFPLVKFFFAFMDIYAAHARSIKNKLHPLPCKGPRNQPPRHGLSTLDDRLRQAVAVVEHNLFHPL